MVQGNKIKIALISGLILALVLLFYLYVTSNNDQAEIKDITKNTYRISSDKISKDIDSILFTFGIKKEWIKENSGKKKELKNKTEEPVILKEIKIPNDLSSIELNYEITNYLRNKNFENKVIEDPKTKNLTMNFYFSNDSLHSETGNLKFIYSDSLKRIAAEICIVLDSLESYDIKDVENILNSTEQNSVFLPLRNDKAEYQSRIIELKKDYLIKFSIGNEEDIEADFKKDMKENVWKAKVKSISLNFPNVSGIILSDKSNLPKFYKEVKDEFLKNNLSVYDENIFSHYNIGGNKINSLLDDLILKSGSEKRFLFYDVNFNPREYSNYDSNIHIMKKLGYKFFNFKDLMKRFNKTPEK